MHTEELPRLTAATFTVNMQTKKGFGQNAVYQFSLVLLPNLMSATSQEEELTRCADLPVVTEDSRTPLNEEKDEEHIKLR